MLSLVSILAVKQLLDITKFTTYGILDVSFVFFQVIIMTR